MVTVRGRHIWLKNKVPLPPGERSRAYGFLSGLPLAFQPRLPFE